MKSAKSLREEALAIWKAGVAAVDSARLIRENLSVEHGVLSIGGESFELEKLNRVIVVGAGKAGAGMATAVEEILEPALGERLVGWINVPEDCVVPLERIHLHAARPAGVNEPTEQGVQGAEEILKLVRSAGEGDLVLVLISGGGSALLPAPVSGITLADKQEVTRFLASAGAPIEELNLVRRTLSAIKGGGLARAAAGAKKIISLIISDVIGDPLNVIASGPTVATEDSPQQAIDILKRRATFERQPPSNVVEWLNQASQETESTAPFPQHVCNILIGTNAVALNAAAVEAKQRGYEVVSQGSNNSGEASVVGVEMIRRLVQLRDETEREKPICLLSGGEPTVTLKPTNQSRKGGRNQELVLAALNWAMDQSLERVALLSGGTDGEDGPTDAAGGFIDEEIRQQVLEQKLNLIEYLEINNAYPCLEAIGGLLKTGPTHTNVMDLRVGLVDRS
ncbi:MAG: DUF4147 domain-containing protein [Planctomycetaceae bacterium]|nr:DUF4147 domain-containing protein [Planctomycetaceae bacterium]